MNALASSIMIGFCYLFYFIVDRYISDNYNEIITIMLKDQHLEEEGGFLKFFYFIS